MPGIIRRDVIDEILSRADIAEIIGSYTQVKRAGGRLKALCPFHQEKTPSFTINEDLKVYYCFGCHKGGNIFNFVMEKENMDFPEAVHYLADRCGIPIRYEESRGGGQNQQNSAADISRENAPKIGKDRLFKLNDLISQWFHRNLLESRVREVSEYVAARKIPEDIISAFRLGAAPDSFDAAIKFCRGMSYSDEEIFCAGISAKSEQSSSFYDRFRKRLIFPVWDEQGRVVGFSARTIEAKFEGGKYINSPETPIFKKSRLLYGMNLARKEMEDKKLAILCEGQFDVISFHRAGYQMAVAPLGTAFSEEQAKLLRRYTSKIYLALDSDGAGMKAALRNMEILLPLDFQVLLIGFPQGEDPDSLLAKHGPEALSDAFSEALDFFDFFFDLFSSKEDIGTPWGKDAVGRKMVQLIARIKSPIVRADYCSELAARLKVSDDAIFSELKKERMIGSRTSGNSQDNSGKEISDAKKAEDDSDSRERAQEALLEIALAHGTAAKLLGEILPPEMISPSPLGKALEKTVSMSLNGEWEFAPKALLESLTENPSASLGRILSESSNIPSDRVENAARECVVKIKDFCLRKESEGISRNLKNAGLPEDEKKRLLARFMEINKELKIIFSEISRIRNEDGN